MPIKKTRGRSKDHPGFTIFELLITTVLIAVLSIIAYQTFSGNFRSRSRDAQRVADVDDVKTAISAFWEKNHKYPPLGAAYSSQTVFISTTIPGGATDWIPELVPNFASKLQQDPQQGSSFYYLYYVSLDRKSYDVWAILENPNDPRIYTNSQAACKSTPPAQAQGHNFCGTGF